LLEEGTLEDEEGGVEWRVWGETYPFVVEELFAGLLHFVVAGGEQVPDVLERRVLEGPRAQHRFEVLAPDLLLLQQQLGHLWTPTDPMHPT
jgi:hypothetical protein